MVPFIGPLTLSKKIDAWPRWRSPLTQPSGEPWSPAQSPISWISSMFNSVYYLTKRLGRKRLQGATGSAAICM